MLNPKLQSAILEIVCRETNMNDRWGKPQPGASVSYLIKCLRSKGWKNLGNNSSEHEVLCEEQGFKMVRICKNGVLLRTYVAV